MAEVEQSSEMRELHSQSWSCCQRLSRPISEAWTNQIEEKTLLVEAIALSRGL